jgi:hypothetical protein
MRYKVTAITSKTKLDPDKVGGEGGEGAYAVMPALVADDIARVAYGVECGARSMDSIGQQLENVRHSKLLFRKPLFASKLAIS